MASLPPPFKVAIVHAAPVFLDLNATVDKACSLIGEAARNGAAVVAFPEAFIPAFPVWSALRAPIYNHDLFCRMAAGAMTVPGAELDRICAAATNAGLIVSLGFNERSEASLGCIYNSNVLIGTDGSILNHHRKIAPTFYEKLTWAAGDGAGLRICDTPCGRIGMLICGENTNPLARYTMIAQAEQVHIASYPPVWPTHHPDTESNYDLAHAIRLRAGAHSFEAKAFTIVASGFMDRAMFEMLSDLDADARSILEHSPRSVSLVTGPSGATIGEQRRDEEGILYADIDVAQCVPPKQFHDISGGYNRFDIFQLTVDRSANRPVTFVARDVSDCAEARHEADDSSVPAEDDTATREKC
jgi:aliphatic nitrilase